LSSRHEAEATALLVELSAQPAVEELVEPEDLLDEADIEDEPALREPATVAAGHVGALYEQADTAALLRELSSLGVEDDPTDAPAAPRTPTHRPPSVDPKKKKRGIFGR
jgi:hypothetical protein